MHANIPNMANLEPRPAQPRLRPGTQAVAAVAGRFRRDLLEQRGGAGRARDRSTTSGQPSLKGRVSVLSEMRDTIGLIMLEQGVDISGDFDDADEFDAAIEVFQEQVDSGQIRNIKGNSYIEDLLNGDTLAAIVLVGRHHRAQRRGRPTSGSSRFRRPAARSGTTTSSIPIGSPRKKNAETLMNYYYDPEVAAEVAAWVNYITPVVGAQEEAEKIDPELAENQLIFPERGDAVAGEDLPHA